MIRRSDKKKAKPAAGSNSLCLLKLWSVSTYYYKWTRMGAKKKAKSDAGENIKLCHLLPTYRIKKRQSLLLRANFACGKFSDTRTRNIRTSPGGPCKGWGTTSLLTKQKRQSRQLSTKREATLPFQPKRLDDLSSWQDKSSSQKGWVSIDRSMVAALPSTTPRPAHKSSTDDLGPPLCQVNEEEKLLGAFDQEAKFPRSGRSPKTIVPRARTEAQRYRCHD